MFRHEVHLILGQHRFDHISSDHQKDLVDERDSRLEAMVWTLKEAERSSQCPIKYQGAMDSATRKYVHVVVDAPHLDAAALKKAVQILTQFKRHTRYTLKTAMGTM